MSESQNAESFVEVRYQDTALEGTPLFSASIHHQPLIIRGIRLDAETTILVYLLRNSDWDTVHF